MLKSKLDMFSDKCFWKLTILFHPCWLDVVIKMADEILQNLAAYGMVSIRYAALIYFSPHNDVYYHEVSCYYVSLKAI